MLNLKMKFEIFDEISYIPISECENEIYRNFKFENFASCAD